MDYEKKYNEALKRARVWKEKSGMPKNKQGILDDIFPELKESKDERIRKAIVATIHLYYGEPLEDEAKEMIAWLEKQGTSYTKRDVDDAYVEGMAFAKYELGKQSEQKPTDEEMKEALRTEYEKGRADAIAEMQNHAWSKKDEERLQSCLNILRAKGLMGVTETINTKWLKSLKERLKGE